MRALQVTAPWGIDRVEVVERPDPQPGPGEVLVRMRAVSLNYRDLSMIRHGAARGTIEGPLTPFSDGCGIVEAVGEGVTRFQVGDRVASMFFQGWIDGRPTPERTGMSALGWPVPGVGREYAVYSQQGLSKPPEFLTDEEVACLPCAALTAWRALFEDAHLEPGESVVLQGTGGVSIFGLQFAKAAGYRTIVTSSSDAKLERARTMGADHLINYRAQPEWARGVREATGGQGADFIMEVGGQGTIQQSMRAVRQAGHIAVIGVLAAGEGAPFNPASLIGNSARLVGVSVGSRSMFEAMCRAIDLHKIRPVVDKRFPFTEVQAALRAMEAGEHFGKIVLTF